MKRGSALLIVLGLLSFMVVSAVAFSAYMRSSRLPSSYLVRTSSSRNLVKAALAEALDDIDRCIGNNPHPGVGTYTTTSKDENKNPQPNRNQWRERVFLGTNEMVGVDQTVSTLTLEGLAYVPAPLINEVRYYSRLSPAAAWHQLDFDAGRFAFTAIDVSDYFDVNRTMAAPGGGGRTSADSDRVSLAYLFEDTGHTSWRVQPSAWDSFMDNFVSEDSSSSGKGANSSGGGNKVPLVSWADLNLAIWDKKPSGVISPWCRFIENGTEFVQDDPTERQTLSNMVFVTDSVYPVPSTESDYLDLAQDANQPFSGLTITTKTSYKQRGVDEIAQNNNEFMKRFQNNISLPELVQLCDYLDADSVPTSLAMPTTERTPMILGVSLNAGSELKFERPEPVTREITSDEKDKDGNPVKKYKVTKYTLKLTGELRPMVAAVYPFKYGRGSDDSDSFKLQVAATLTLVPKDSEKALRRNNAASPAVCPWENGKKAPEAVAYNGAGDFKSVMIMRSDMKPLTLKRNPQNEQDCLIGPVDPEFGTISFDLATKMDKSQYDTEDKNEVCTLRVVQEVNPKDNSPIGNPEITKGFLPSKEDLSGAVAMADITDSAEYVPVIQFWVRIVNQNDDTVDLMPACVADDKRPSELLNGDRVKSAFERPLLRFYDKDGGMVVSFTQKWFDSFQNKMMTIAPHAYVADDPRFNHAPEDLVAVENLTGEVQKYWLDNNTAKNGDGDIFMTTSDTGFLQSKFEIMHLLHLTGLDESSDMWGVLDNGGYDGEARPAFGNAPSKSAQWNTYSLYSVAGRAIDKKLAELKMYNGSSGTRVCPYTPDLAVMMGALANTPRDWWAASPEDDEAGDEKKKMLSDIDTALKYTFSDHSEDASSKIRWQDMQQLASKFISEFRSSTPVDGWEDIYERMDWDGTLFDDIGTGFSVRLDSVDRKYLFGFWHDCFAARQQLFLVFVRAEPMMMGGGTIGQMPPMLGARAVALVWRSPTKTQNNAPHQMRILFYRQFD